MTFSPINPGRDIFLEMLEVELELPPEPRVCFLAPRRKPLTVCVASVSGYKTARRRYEVKHFLANEAKRSGIVQMVADPPDCMEQTG